MMIYVMIIIKTFLIAWFITTFRPIQFLVEKINVNGIINLFKCMKCLSFWISMIMLATVCEFNIYINISSAIIGYVYEKYFMETKIKL